MGRQVAPVRTHGALTAMDRARAGHVQFTNAQCRNSRGFDRWIKTCKTDTTKNLNHTIKINKNRKFEIYYDNTITVLIIIHDHVSHLVTFHVVVKIRFVRIRDIFAFSRQQLLLFEKAKLTGQRCWWRSVVRRLHRRTSWPLLTLHQRDSSNHEMWDTWTNQNILGIFFFIQKFYQNTGSDNSYIYQL